MKGRQQKNERQEKEESLTFVKDALWGTGKLDISQEISKEKGNKFLS